jgi:pimeloyl-ACP methyl ester carboxylesterase
VSAPSRRLETFDIHSVRLAYQDAGEGAPFVFQHGLGGDHGQTFSLVRPRRAGRQLTLDCRGHGTSSLGDPELLSFATFAMDLLALVDALGVRRVALGGISMGAGVALACACMRPPGLLIDALVLVRPAWGTGPMGQPACAAYQEIAQLLRSFPPAEAAERFKRSPVFCSVLREGPAAAQSLLGHFADPRASEMIELYERLPLQAPIDAPSLAGLHIPTLIIGTDQDPIHPLDVARQLADQLAPNASLAQVTSKTAHPQRHQRQTEQLVYDFLDARAKSAG